MLNRRKERRLGASEHLSNLDEFGNRQYIHPAEVKGRFRDRRNRVYSVLLVVFLALPWIRINGLQAILLDVPNRRFEIFGMLFLAHDTPLLFFLLALAVLTIALTTAVWGRLWCGWACPQTVFIDAVYRRIEILIEGDYIARRELS
jgi:polyferredoxin